MIIAFGTAVEIALQFTPMNEFRAARAFDPAAKAVFLRALDFDLGFTA